MSEPSVGSVAPSTKEKDELLDYMKFGNGSVTIKQGPHGIYIELGKNIARKDKGEPDNWINYRVNERGCVEAMAIQEGMDRFIQMVKKRKTASL